MDKCLLQVQLTLGVELGALVEDTSASCTGASTDQVGQDTTTETRVDVGGVTGVGGFVAARELSLVTTLGLTLLNGHTVGDGPLDVAVAAVAGRATVLGLHAIAHVLSGHGSSQGGEGEDDGAQRELHCDGGN